MKRIIPKLGLQRMSQGTLISFSRHVLQEMAGNENFPSPAPPLTELSSAIDNYFNAFEFSHGSRRAHTQFKKQTRWVLEDILTLMAYHCVLESKGLASKFLTSGFSMKGGNENKVLLPAPHAITAKEGPWEGTVRLKWKMSAPCRSYVVEMTDNIMEEMSWKQIGTSSKTKLIVKNLESAKRYWFRVRAFNSSGESASSPPASRITQ